MMKHLSFATLCILLPCALLALAPAAPLFADDLNVEEIIANHTETVGGEEAWAAIKSARISANFAMGPMSADLSIVFMRPKKYRVETEIQGMKMIRAYDGEQGWGVMPMMGQSEPELVADEELKEIQNQADFDGPLIGYKEDGDTVELVGKEEVEGTEAYKLKVTKKSGDITHLYLDTEYFLIFRQETRSNVQGTEMNVTSNISDYKEVGDVVMAHSTVSIPEGMPGGITTTIKNVELNVEVDETQFAFPEKPAAEEEDKKAEE